MLSPNPDLRQKLWLFAAMFTEKRQYLAYLLRIWQVKDAGKLVWRASLEDPHTSVRRGFISVEALIDFLLEQVRYNACDCGMTQHNNEIE